MLANGYGKILITSSIAGEMVAPREPVYAASKAYDLSFAKSLRAELEDTGISVTALQPGPVGNEIRDRALEPGLEALKASMHEKMAKPVNE